MRSSKRPHPSGELLPDRSKLAPLPFHSHTQRPGRLAAFAGFAGLAVWSLFVSATVQAQCYLRPTNIVAWWPGDGHPYDVINVKAAALQNGAGYTAGEVCQAFSFDGSNEKVRIPNNTYLRQTNRWTLEAWVRPASFNNSINPTIYSEGSRTVALGLNQGTGKLESWINNNNAASFISTAALTLNGWTHVALVRDVNTRTFYINGLAAGSTNNTPTTVAGAGGAAIGHDTPDGPDTALLGDLDELSLYQRALTAGEIAAIYAAGSAGKCFSTTNPLFFVQPVSQTAYLGSQAEFTALAIGSPCVTYQWLFNGTNLAGQNSSALSFSNIAFTHEGDYALVATSGANSATSSLVHLTVRFCADTPSGLVGWWPGDGSSLDVTGNHPGSAWGNLNYPAGIAGRAFGFNGTDTYVAVPDSPALSPHSGTNGEMTVEAWVYLSAFPSTDPYTGQNRRVVVGKGDSGRWEYSLNISTAGIPEFFVWPPAGTDYYGSVTGGQVLLNQWCHLVGVLKKGQFIRIYQDGQLMAESTTLSGDTSDTDTPFYIGRRSDGLFLNGRVDEVALYNRALDTNEITVLYNGGAFGKCHGASSPAPFFAIQPVNASGYYFLSAGLSALALGTPRPDYQWYRSNSPTAWGLVSNATNASLSFSNLNGTERGFYRVLASNVSGSVTSQPAWLDVICHPIVCSPNGEDFENGWNGWTADNEIWQVGVPSGTTNGIAATVLNGNYPDDRTAWLISPPFVVPPAREDPRLRFWHYFTFSCADYGQLFIRTNGGAWLELAYYPGHSGGVWSRPSFDLTAYAGRTVELGFYFYSANSSCNGNPVDVSDGWDIDEIVVVTGPREQWAPNVPESFEDGQRDWYVTSGTWEIGPGVGVGGSSGAATVRSGSYADDTSSWLIGPPFTVPPAGDTPRLRFWHYFTFSCADGGQLYIRTNGGSWQLLDSYSGHSGGVWCRPSFDLTAYAGRTVELGFYFYSANSSCNGNPVDVSDGWDIDEIVVVTGPREQWAPNVPESFEDGQRDWYVTSGTWEIGPGVGVGGSSGAATVRSGSYADDTSSWLIGPPFTVPPAGDTPRLRFWHYFTFSCADGGQLYIRTNGGSWQLLDSYSGHSGGVWSRPSFDLTAYAGRTVELGFYFYSANSSCNGNPVDVSDGWDIDEITIVTGAPVVNVPECFESGLGDWYVLAGTWEVGRPTSGPGGAHSGTIAAGTVLRGDYYDDTSSSLVGPLFMVPPTNQNPRLVLWHWYSFSCDDFGEVRIWNGGQWDTLASFSGSQTIWDDVELPLTAYAGRAVQVGLYFYSRNSTCNGSPVDVSAGWYVDDIFVKQGNLAMVPVADKTIAETNCLTFPVNVIGADGNSILSFSLGAGAPAGAQINADTGVFTWCPTECQGPGTYVIPIYVVDYGHNEANDLGFVRVTVTEVNERPWLMAHTNSVDVLQTNLISLVCWGDPDCPKNSFSFTLLSDAPAGTSIDNNGVFRWVPTLAQLRTEPYVMRVQLCDNGTPNYCVTNFLSLTVTTNCVLQVEHLGNTDFRFTIVKGRTDRDYELEQSAMLCGPCGCAIPWQPAGTISPTTIPFSVTLRSDYPFMFFRLKEVPKP